MTPATFSDLSFVGGFLAGFASSLHCIGMCGGIATSLTLSLGGADAGPGRQARILLLAQLGRILAYIMAGGLLAALGSTVYIGFDQTGLHLILRWAAAVVLVYIGLSVAGWAPSLAGFDRVGHHIVTWTQKPFAGTLSSASPLVAGFVWGFLPCGMVYAMLFYAMLTGHVGTGMLIMAGFGLGTVPAVILSVFGFVRLLGRLRSPRTRIMTGLLIILVAVASAALPWRTIAALCGIPVD